METIPLCMICKHLDRVSPVMRCAAFPGRIPAEIVAGRVQHTGPYPGDHGTRFEPEEGPKS